MYEHGSVKRIMYLSVSEAVDQRNGEALIHVEKCGDIGVCREPECVIFRRM